MESIVGLVFSGENLRLLVLVALAYAGYVRLMGQIKDLDARLTGQIKDLDRSVEKKIDALDHKIDGVEISLNKRIDEVESSLSKQIDEKLLAFHTQLKANDFAHLNSTIEALTFTLEKNGFLKREDKEYIDSRLDS